MARVVVSLAYDPENVEGYIPDGGQIHIEGLIKSDPMAALDILQDWSGQIEEYRSQAFDAVYGKGFKKLVSR